MDTTKAKEVEKAVVITSRGTKGVHVSLQYEPRLKGGSRSQRRKLLIRQFGQIAKALALEGADVDLESISVSAQTVEAVLPLDHYQEITNVLVRQQIRVDPLFDRQIVPE